MYGPKEEGLSACRPLNKWLFLRGERERERGTEVASLSAGHANVGREMKKREKAVEISNRVGIGLHESNVAYAFFN